MTLRQREPAWRRYARFLRPDADADIDAELRFHLEERIAQLVGRGVSAHDARKRALAEFGDVRAVRNDLRTIDARMAARRSRTALLAALVDDARLALRRLVRQPAFSLPAVLTLAIGVAATVAIATLLHAVVLAPLPFSHADRLVALDSPMPKLGDRWGIARHQLFYYAKEARGIEAMALYRSDEGTLMGDGAGRRAERLPIAVVSAGIFDVLGIRPEMGRVLLPSDNLSEPPTVAVLGYDAWTSRFGGNPAILGQKIDLEGYRIEVVGVAARGAQLPDRRVDIWIPDYVDPAMAPMNNHTRAAVARLRPGWSAAMLERELRPLTLRMEELFPQAYGNHWITRTGFSTAVRPLRDAVVGETVTRALWILLAAVGLLFTIALANVANLFLVRGEGQLRELSLRQALGADRARLAVHHLGDALIVATIAGALASGVVNQAVREIVALAPAGIPRLAELHPSWGQVAMTMTLALAAGVVVSLVPMLGVRPALTSLREGGTRMTASRRRIAVRGALVAAQVALAVVLLTGASLLVRSFQRLRAVELGFSPAGVTTMALALPSAHYRDHAKASAFYEQLAGLLQQRAGVRAVGFATLLPLTGAMGCTVVLTDGSSGSAPRGKCVPELQASPGYFETMGIRLAGRAPTWDETHARAAGVVVSRALANVLWPGEDPIGRGVRCCSDGPPYFTVVGVAEDVHDEGLESPPMQAVYFPLVPGRDLPMNAFPGYMTLVMRAPTLPARAIAGMVQQAAASIDPQVPIAEPQSMDAVVARSMARRTFTMTLLGIAASAALLLSAIGLYGVVSYTVLQRRGEIGIRVALGARTATVALMVARQSLRIVALGLVLGIGGALLGTRIMSSLLYEVSPTDPTALLLVVATLLLVAALATFAPTWKATRVDATETLRGD